MSKVFMPQEITTNNRYAKETRQGNVQKRETYEQYAEKFNKGENNGPPFYNQQFIHKQTLLYWIMMK